MTTVLDLNLVETYQSYSIGIADISTYTSQPTNVSFELTIPGYNKTNIPFVPNVVNIFYSYDILPTCADPNQDKIALPDGIYSIRYSVSPNDINWVEKSFIRTFATEAKFYKTFLAIDTKCACNGVSKQQELKDQLRNIKLLIDGAIASSNVCDITSSYEMLKKANSLLDKIKQCNC